MCFCVGACAGVEVTDYASFPKNVSSLPKFTQKELDVLAIAFTIAKVFFLLGEFPCLIQMMKLLGKP